MNAGMAGVIAGHRSVWECMGGYEDDRAWLECSCRDSIKNDVDNWTGDTEAEHAAHVAEELTNAGYGLVNPLAAGLADPEGHALVKVIHDRKPGN